MRSSGETSPRGNSEDVVNIHPSLNASIDIKKVPKPLPKQSQPSPPEKNPTNQLGKSAKLNKSNNLSKIPSPKHNNPPETIPHKDLGDTAPLTPLDQPNLESSSDSHPENNNEQHKEETTENVTPQEENQPEGTEEEKSTPHEGNKEENTKVEGEQSTQENASSDSLDSITEENYESWANDFLSTSQDPQLKSFVDFALKKILSQKEQLEKFLEKDSKNVLNKIPETTSEILSTPKRTATRSRARKPSKKPIAEVIFYFFLFFLFILFFSWEKILKLKDLLMLKLIQKKKVEDKELQPPCPEWEWEWEWE